MTSKILSLIQSARLHATLLTLITCFCIFLSPSLYSQTNYNRLSITNDGWLKPFPPIRIINNLYFVGTFELGSFLITSDAGHILINTGPYGSAPMIKSSVEALGFKFEDIAILLTTQAHWDHVADLAEIKRQTGARMYAHEDDVASLEDGGVSDFRFPEGREAVFEPIKVDRRLRDGDVIELGNTSLILHHHPGHTKGASSFSFNTTLDNENYSVLIVNMGTINPGVKLLGMPDYQTIANEFRDTFIAQKELSPDIYVSSHAGHFDLHEKFIPGDPYDPKRFLDPGGYQEKINFYQQLFIKQLQEEQQSLQGK
jgi:metallo-beta-lactamase class B